MTYNRIFVVESEYAKVETKSAKKATEPLMTLGYFVEDDVFQENIHHHPGYISVGYRGGCIFGITFDGIPQPHFCLIVGYEVITFDLETGKKLENEISYEQLNEFIQVYWELDRIQIAELWNKTRRDNRFTMPSHWRQDLSNSNGIERLYNSQPPKNDGSSHTPAL